MEVSIFTDGSIIKNPGEVGAWAYVIVAGGREKVVSGYVIEEGFTNNRAEMMAALYAIREFSYPTDITLYSDSEYLIKGFTEGRVEKWASNNWRRKVKNRWEEIPNADLWDRLNILDLRHRITWKHVRGHTGSADELSRCNEICHQSAITAARIAWEYHSRGWVPPTLPKGLESRIELLAALKEMPDPPEPPRHEPREVWGVFRRKSKKEFEPVAEVMPMEVNRYEDGGRWFCIETARKMNRMMRENPESKKTMVAGLNMFEAKRIET